jgi:hypothetical protein
MSLMISTGLRNHLLDTGSFIAAADGMLLHIYGSPTSQAAANALIPSSADDAVGSATLLCTVSVSGAGTGLGFETTAVSGVIAKDSAESWYGENLASGYASFYRLTEAADDGSASTTTMRAQGTVGTVGTDLIIANAYMTIGEEQRVDSYVVGLPAA